MQDPDKLQESFKRARNGKGLFGIGNAVSESKQPSMLENWCLIMFMFGLLALNVLSPLDTLTHPQLYFLIAGNLLLIISFVSVAFRK